MPIIHYKRTVNFIGRNGYFKCRGLLINSYEDFVTLVPITSKGATGNCMIDIPKESIKHVISALKKGGK